MCTAGLRDGRGRGAIDAVVIAPVLVERADLVLGSRLRGSREPGSLGAPQVVAGRIAGVMLRAP